MIKRLSFILLIFILSCAKDTSEDDSSVYVSPPSNTTNTGSTSTTVSQYSLTVSAGEGGSVSTSGGTYNDGTSINIIATPSEGYEFIGWIGSDSTSSNITLTISSNVTISANFQIDCSYWQYEVPDWKKTSYELFDIIYPEKYSQVGNLLNNQWGSESGEYGFNVIVVDYNNDGYRDVIGFHNDYSNFVAYPQDYYGYERKQMIRFYKGTCGGNFEVDEQNDNKILGTVHGRKVLLGDFNNDGYVDVFFISHGYDNIPFKGEYSKAIFSDGSGGFYDTEYTDFVSFYHGGATGDIDNDGDLDLVIVEGGRGKSLVYLNNGGVLNPSSDLIDQDLAKSMYNAELFDLNNDGYLDLIMGGHDWWNQWSTSYDTLPLVVYGDGIDFIDNDYIRLPEANVNRQGLVSNFEFFDLNNDGNIEIILTRTGDGLGEEPNLPWNERNFYKNWSVQVLELSGNEYLDKTNEFIDFYSGTEPWIKFTKIRDKDNDGVIEMFNNVNPYNDLDNYLEWKIIGGKLIKQ